MATGLDFGLTEALSRPAGNVLCAKSHASSAVDGMPPEELQQLSWQQLFADPTQWWDNRRSKRSTQHPDFRHKKSNVALWLHKPAWADSGMKKHSADQGQGAFRTAAVEEHLEVGMCRKLCEDGRITDALDALKLLVQRGCHVDNNLFYLVLRRCKDLALVRCIHALTVKSGYEGDAFLATHLIGLYASHGELEEAQRLFSNVPTPNSYVWATIIFANARHGKAAEAIRLYRQMREANTVKPTDHIYVAVLKACGAARDLVAGKEVHAHILAGPRKADMFVQTGIVNMYAKCGSLEDARTVFDGLPKKDVVTWTAMLAGYAQQGMGQQALSLYNSMQQGGLTPPDSVTYVCLLQACASVGALDQGKQLHGQIEERGLQDDVVLGGSLVNMYAKCGSLEDARSMFDTLSVKNVFTWTAMIAGYAQQGMGQEALSLYSSMQQEGLTPLGSVTYVCLLQACASVGVGALDQGKRLHAQIKVLGLQDDVVLCGSLVNMYAKCGRLEDARIVFDTLPARTVVSWTAMIAGYAQQRMGQEALSLYSNMQEEGLAPPDSVTYVCLLQACANIGVGALDQGKRLHEQIEELGIQDNVAVGCSLVHMYAKCGRLEDARNIFDRIPARTVVSWTAMIAGYAQQGMGQEALSLYNRMQQEGLTAPDSVTYVCLLQACATEGVGALHQGKQLHAQIQDQGLQDAVAVGNSLINMYSKCGSVEDARIVFDRHPERDVVTWNAMIAGYAHQGMDKAALGLYNNMQQKGLTPDSVTYLCVLQACSSDGVGALDQGKQLHAQIKERGLQDDGVVGSSLVNMYAKCGSLDDARSVFNKLAHRDVVTWTAMIAGYAHQGMGQEALSLYNNMQQEGLTPPDSATYTCLLQACAIVAALPLGKQLHAQIEEQGLQADPVVGAALVNMYAKSGSMVDSQQVFDSMPERPIEAWNALTSGYSRQGDSEVVFQLVDRMRLEGIQPDGLTFLIVLTVCSHVGLVDEGLKYFEAMKADYGISPTIEHYTCMVDLLGRAGHLDKALWMAKAVPFPPNSSLWHTLLGACRKWNNVEIGQQALSLQ